MEEQQNVGDQIQFLLNDFSTRLRDIDERNRLIRERVLLIGKNLINSKEDLENSLNNIKKENREIKKELDRLDKMSKNLIFDSSKFVKRDEIILVERMLKDFQPLEFMRKKDVEELIEKRLNPSLKKQIKTTEAKI